MNLFKFAAEKAPEYRTCPASVLNPSGAVDIGKTMSVRTVFFLDPFSILNIFKELVMKFGRFNTLHSATDVPAARRGFPAAYGAIKKFNVAIAFLALLASPIVARAATYYVSPNGNDSNSGTSDAQAWKTVAKVNSHKFSAGDDIYFKCGGTWSGTALQPNVQGVNDANRTVIGAYYGSGTFGVSGAKPIIDGAPTGTGESQFGSVPTKASYNGLVHFSNKSYVTIENLHIQWSGAVGLELSGGEYNIVSNCYIGNAYRQGIRVAGASTHCIIQYNEVTGVGRSRLDGLDFPPSIGIIGGSPSPATSNHLIKGNYVYLNHGEGIGLYKGAHDNVVEYNTLVNNRSANMYFGNSSQRNTIRYNLIYGYATAPWIGSNGIAFNDESQFSYADSYTNTVYGNLIANCNTGISLRTQHIDSVVKDMNIYNNTLVDNLTGVFVSDGPWENSNFQNNIVWCTGEKTSCSLASIPFSHSGLTFASNLWSSQPTTGARGTNDPAYGAPLLVKKTGWKSITLGSLTGKEFALTSSSPAIGTGTKVALPFNELLNVPIVDFTTHQYKLVDQNAHGAWEIGASVFTTTSTATINPPAQLQLAITP